MTSLAWQQRRSSFNHDWLKNQYIPALEKFLNLLDDLLVDAEFEKTFVTAILPIWEANRTEALQLPRDFEQHMSPQILLSHPPLSSLDDETRQWLGNALHNLWLARYPIQYWITNVIKCAEAAANSYEQICRALQDCPNPQSAASLVAFRALFHQFCHNCRVLARAIEMFPSEVRVV